ncbi:MAG TPA: glycosyltransferase family 4 protein [Gaiellaceae bacterium]|nr:glycosyltransferase family 4 protein [Gaiellaceae bacterium]
MPRDTAPTRKLVHVVVTRNFAGVERHVAGVARETAERGWRVTVVGGAPAAMRRSLGDVADWLPGGTPLEALRSLARVGRVDVCHAHMTLAETVAVAGRPFHRAPVVATRHFGAHRGQTRVGGAVAPWIARRVARELAVSEFVAGRMERPPHAVVPNGVPAGPLSWRPESRVVLLLQRLEREKDTLTALRAWRECGLESAGWSLRIAGDGSERRALEAWVATNGVPGVDFAGWREDPAAELAAAGILLATAPSEPFGLAVVEAMVAGVPVVAAAGGAHLETVGLLPDVPLFPPGDAAAAAEALRRLADPDLRARLSEAGRGLALERFTLGASVDRLLAEYDLVGAEA